MSPNNTLPRNTPSRRVSRRDAVKFAAVLPALAILPSPETWSMEKTVLELEALGYRPMANVFAGEINGLTMGYPDPLHPGVPRVEVSWDHWHVYTSTQELRVAMSDYLFSTGRIWGTV